MRLARLAGTLVEQRGVRVDKHGLWALVLDSPALASSKALQHYSGFRAQRIIVPNDSGEEFGSDVARHATLQRGTSLQDFLCGRGRMDHGPFACIYLDFTTCFDGSWRPAAELEMPTANLASDGQGACTASPAEDVRALFEFEHVDPDGAVLAVTLAHVRDPGRSARFGGNTLDQWERLRLLVASSAFTRGFCAIPVPARISQAAVATEFWLLGRVGDRRLSRVLQAECDKWLAP